MRSVGDLSDRSERSCRQRVPDRKVAFVSASVGEQGKYLSDLGLLGNGSQGAHKRTNTGYLITLLIEGRGVWRT
jgi:hypothetical protein